MKINVRNKYAKKGQLQGFITASRLIEIMCSVLKKMKSLALCLALTACGDGAGNDPEYAVNLWSLNRLGAYSEASEGTPVVLDGNLYMILSYRPANAASEVSIENAITRASISRFTLPDFTLISAIEVDGTVYIYGITGLDQRVGAVTPGNAIRMIKCTDLINCTAPVIIYSSPNEAIYNTSITRTDNGFVLAYDFHQPGLPYQFTQRFLHTTDLEHFSPIGGTFPHEYSAGVTLRYLDGVYHMVTHVNLSVGWGEAISHSADLYHWTEPVVVMKPVDGEGINNSDIDFEEFDGKVYIFYIIGDQTTWSNMYWAVYNGTLRQLMNSL